MFSHPPSSAMVSLHTALLIPERFNGIEARRLVGRQEAKDNADQHGEQNRSDDDVPRNEGRPTGEQRDEGGRTPSEQNADDPADERQSHGLDEKLKHDLAPCRPDSHADADFPRPLCNGDEHNVHHADSAHEQRDAGDAPDDGGHDAGNLADPFRQRFHVKHLIRVFCLVGAVK